MQVDARIARAADLETAGWAAKQLGVSTSYAHRLIRHGKLDWVAVGKYKLILKHQVYAMMVQRKAS